MTRRPTIAEVQWAVAAEYRVPLRVMSSERRDRSTAHPRQAAMALCLDLTGRSSGVIARHFNRDSSTIRQTRSVITARRQVDPALHRRLQRLEGKLTEGPLPAGERPVQLAFLNGPLFDLGAAA